ncbi:MAG: hypothetical protein ABR588_00390 [Sphingomicrobium sp.]|nr:hypothetical protein [Sphingomonadales bacterium]
MTIDRVEMTEKGQLTLAQPIPQVYFNGFQLGLSNADISLVLLLDNQPILKMNMSYTVGKTVLVKLQDMVALLESTTGREIMTTDDAGRGLEGAQQ